ncbi:sugar ABC transporter permease [Alicyclobacillus hesperidum]|uniref:Sugar ABC transporter permease n=2 Tax=Alicyclobacillus hesperidum TaxID=89784 RepID=A0AA37U6L1_9BACL|nr:sugar ABC transporter permease [Alicyclobacillus hesperidum]
MMNAKRLRLRLTHSGVHIVLIILCAVCITPLFWMIRTALAPSADILSSHLWPNHLAFGNFVTAWHAQPFLLFLGNSLLTNATIVACQLGTSALAAYSLVFIPYPGKRLVFFTTLLAMMVPMQATFVPIYSMLSTFHLINTYGALILPFVGSAFGIFLMRQGFLSIPKEMVQAARVDGATEWQILVNIVLPHAKPTVATLVLLNFVYHYNSLFWPLIATNTNNMRVVPVALSYFLTQDAGQSLQWNLAMAFDVFAIAPVVILFLLGQRYFVQGVTGVSLKG